MHYGWLIVFEGVVRIVKTVLLGSLAPVCGGRWAMLHIHVGPCTVVPGWQWCGAELVCRHGAASNFGDFVFSLRKMLQMCVGGWVG